MKESYGEEIANHTGLEPCELAHKGKREASAEVRAGWVLSPEMSHVPDADALSGSGRQYSAARQRESRRDLAGSETPRMHGTTLRENREIPRLPVAYGGAGRMEKPEGTSP